MIYSSYNARHLAKFLLLAASVLLARTHGFAEPVPDRGVLASARANTLGVAVYESAAAGEGSARI